MSRLVELLEERALPGAAPLTVAGLRAFVDALVARLDAPGGRIEIAFPFFVRKTAPVSGVASLARLRRAADRGARRRRVHEHDRHRRAGDVALPVLEGNFRRTARTTSARSSRSTVRPRAPVLVTELVRIAEEEASCELYGILKRADEKYVTERAYDNPRFVEDLVRGVALRLARRRPLLGAYTVEAENFESIHNHSAYARIARGWD